MRQLFAIAMAMVMAGACGEVDGVRVDAPPGDDGGMDDGPMAAVPVAPVPPAVGRPAYQGGQRQLRTQLGGTCTGRIAASMSGTGFCYLAADDNVKCSGVIGGVNYGMTPTNIGQTGVEQIMLFFFLDNGMCVTRSDHTVHCMGMNTNAFGSTLTTTFSRWTARDDIAAIATGTWDQICGITLTGQVYCGGNPGGNPAYGQPPMAVGAPGQSSVWVDTGGAARLSDTTVLRPGESRTECTVQESGLVCGGTAHGPTGNRVVSGGRSSGNPADFTCWLDGDGTVGCTNGPRFEPGKVMFLASSYYTDSLCAIYNDGSIWCLGTNINGKLGTGNTATLAAETMVAPPGTARVRCD
jgi:hypothetical protein